MKLYELNKLFNETDKLKVNIVKFKISYKKNNTFW